MVTRDTPYLTTGTVPHFITILGYMSIQCVEWHGNRYLPRGINGNTLVISLVMYLLLDTSGNHTIFGVCSIVGDRSYWLKVRFGLKILAIITHILGKR